MAGPNCAEGIAAADAARITLLTDRIAARETAITTLTTRNGELTDLITGHETRIAELTARNVELTDLVTEDEIEKKSGLIMFSIIDRFKCAY